MAAAPLGGYYYSAWVHRDESVAGGQRLAELLSLISARASAARFDIELDAKTGSEYPEIST